MTAPLQSVKRALRRTWPVLLVYGLFSAWGIGCLLASLALTEGWRGGASLAPLAGLLAGVVVGHLLGNALGLAGFRLVPILILFASLFVGGSLLGAALGPLVLFAIGVMFAALGGYLGIASRLDVVAAWYPLSFAVGAAIHWMNAHGAIAIFETGAKHRLWDPFTVLCLGGTTFLMLAFLATRNSLALTVWQEAGAGGGAVDGAEAAAPVARPGRGSFVVLFVFTLGVLGATALLSPYLFRTRHSDTAEQSDRGRGSERRESQRRGRGGSNGTRRGGADGEETDSAQSQSQSESEAAREAMSIAARLLMGLLVLALLFVLLGMGVGRPVRRGFFLAHLEKPRWPVAPTARVMNLWRRALAELAVVGIEPATGETPSAFASRAEAEIATTLGGEAIGLRAAAEIVEKIDYAGRGLGREEEEAMRAAAMGFVAAFAPLVPRKKRIAAAWGPAPEIEP